MLDRPDDSVRVRSARITASSPPEVKEVPAEAQEIERTRNHMSDTIEQIQDRLTPERMADEAKETASEVTDDVQEAVTETIDHVMKEVRTTADEWSEIARVAALETIDHAIAEAKSALPTVSEQAQQVAQATIDHAIVEAKAAIRELGEQTRLAMRDATIGKVERMAQTTGESTKSFSSTLVTRVKQNPGPAALAGLGIGWLMMGGKGGSPQGQSSASSVDQLKGKSDELSSQVKDSTNQAQDKLGDAAGQAQDATGKAVDQAQDAAGKALDQAQDVTGKAVDQVQNAAGTATDQTKQVASTVTEQTKQLTGKVSTQVQQLSARFRQTVDQKPLAAGAVAVAVGSAAALIVPVTPREQQLMGGTRDKLMDKAQIGAQGLVEKVQRVAEEAGEAAEKEAKYQGLSPEE
ncbi:MAG: DUF3618 domain-containing protein [Chloroflexota bacterium]|nr:DUF3618 domain-containing protein [Chloroflexota bacterium]